ncbi:hypothetical protein BGZ73_007824 [Actinomortierella ambigua]|nr:hypothetical protein BGZ73_007824 [Actinomortierella ambigua]
MLESLMVFPNDNHFFNLPQHFDDGMAKLMQQQEQIETFIASASASPNAMAFSNTMPQLIPSAPASPSYPIIKTESSEEHHFQRLRQHQSHQQQQQQVDFLMYPSFEMQGQQSATASPTQPQHVVASQISSPIAITTAPSTQPRLAPAHSDVDLFHQRQQHQQQQQRHAQQLRLQHQQQQRMMEQQQQQFSQSSFSQSTSTPNMMIPVTTTTLSAMLDAVCSAPVSAMPMVQPAESEHFVPATVATSMPLFESNQESFQRQPSYVPAKTHPASPSARRASPTLMDTIPSPTMPVAIVPNMSASSSPAPAVLAAAPISSPSASAPILTRVSTSSRLDKVKPSRTTRITKSTSSTSSTSSVVPTDSTPSATTAMSRAAKAASTRAAKRAAATTGTTSETATTVTATIPAPTAPVVYQHLPGSHGNVTHPRRAAQNRAAQRTFRNRRKAYIKDLESKVQQLDSTKVQNEQLVSENQRLLQHAQQLEQMLAEAGFRLHPGMSLTEMDLSVTFRLSKGAEENGEEGEEDERRQDGSDDDADQKTSSSEEQQGEKEHSPMTESNIQRLGIHHSL